MALKNEFMQTAPLSQLTLRVIGSGDGVWILRRKRKIIKRATNQLLRGGSQLSAARFVGGDESTTTLCSSAMYLSWYGDTPYTISTVAPDVEHAASFNGTGGIWICFTCWVLQTVCDVSVQIQT